VDFSLSLYSVQIRKFTVTKKLTMLFSRNVDIFVLSTLLITTSATDYGADISFPIHHKKLSTNYDWLPHNVDPDNNPTPKEYENMPVQPLGDKQKFYDDFLDGCRKHYGRKGGACDSTESDRIAMSLRQPQAMVNYTDLGFKKIRAPESMFKLIKTYWDEHKHKKYQNEEQWGAGNTYTNNWIAPTHMLSVEDRKLRGGGSELKQKIWNEAKATLEEWTGQELRQCSLYGIRVYQEGSILATHVDRMPLVSSAIINVDQDVDEPWPIEVISHDGRSVNVTMEPGDMVLYESHSVLHGRPFPLNGRFYANLFVHFEPVGHTLRHHGYEPDESDYDEGQYRDSVKKGHSGHEHHTDGMPDYILSGSVEDKTWHRSHPNGERTARSKPAEFTTGSTSMHTAARNGDLKKISNMAMIDKNALSQKDANGWQPLHEAARAGQKDVVKVLMKYGVDVNSRTNNDTGGTALWYVIQTHGKDHPLVSMLKEAGGVSIEPEL